MTRLKPQNYKAKDTPMRAVYAFSGDPITYGHIDIVQRAAHTYDELVVAIGENPDKTGNYLFTSEERLEMARSARDASTRHTGSAPMEIMDVNMEAVANAFRKHKTTRMIHGHTHRPATHLVDLGDSTAERIVLAAWYQAGSYLEVSPQGVNSVTLQGKVEGDPD